MSRYWDGCVRAVEGRRHVSDGNGKQMRVERLSCGHEQVFHGATFIAPGSKRVCQQCSDEGRKEA